MDIVKNLLPVGSVVLLKGGVKKTLIIGILQINENISEDVYDYIGVPYPEGYLGMDNTYLFQHEDINDVIFRGYDNPEREDFMKLMELVMKKAQEQLE